VVSERDIAVDFLKIIVIEQLFTLFVTVINATTYASLSNQTHRLGPHGTRNHVITLESLSKVVVTVLLLAGRHHLVNFGTRKNNAMALSCPSIWKMEASLQLGTP
jgi:hypothetical protein